MGGPTPTRASRGCILAPPDRGAMGASVGGEARQPPTGRTPIHLGEARTFEEIPSTHPCHEANETLMGLLLGILLELLGILLGILPDVLGFTRI